MAEQGDEREEVEAGPVDGGGVTCLPTMGIAGFLATEVPTVEEPEGGGDYGCFEGEAEKGVGEAAVVFEGCDGAFYELEAVDVGEDGGDGHCGGGVGGFAVEADAREDGSGQDVSEWVHWVSAY